MKPTSRDAAHEIPPPVPGIAEITAAPLLLPTERQRMVAEAAYYRFLTRGGAPGDPLQDWLEAEAEIGGRPPEA